MARVGLTLPLLTERASEMADEIGFENVTVLALARSFGVKDASLYSHIKNLRDLRQRVAMSALSALADRAAAALAGRAGKDALVAFADAYRDYAREHPGRYAATQLELDSDAAEASDARRHSQLSRAVLRAYDLAEPDETDAVRLLGSMFHGYIALEAAGGFGHTPRSSEDSWNKCLDILHHALDQWPSNQSAVESTIGKERDSL